MLAWLVAELWGSELVAVHGSVLRPAEFPGFIAERSRRVVGLLTYQLVGDMLEIVTLNGRDTPTAPFSVIVIRMGWPTRWVPRSVATDTVRGA